MLRAASRCAEPLELLARRRDVLTAFRAAQHSAPSAQDTPTSAGQTVLTSSATGRSTAPAPPAPPAPPPPPPPLLPLPPQARRSWTLTAAALALTASLGGAYFYRKMSDSEKEELDNKAESDAGPSAGAGEESREPGELYPASGAELPARVEFLVVGGGTAAFAALRALRAARPDAAILVAGAERAPPYMRPPLSKELWRRDDLPQAARDPLKLTFTQWNGKRRSVVYEPLSFYTPLATLAAGGAGAGLARGWRVAALDLRARTARLAAPGQPPATVAFDKCLLATGSVPRRLGALAPAAAAGRSLTLHALADVARVAELAHAPATRRIAVVGGGLLATELAASLADKLRGSGKEVVQVYRERAPLQELLPHYLAADAAARLAALGVTQMPDTEIESSAMEDGRVVMRLGPAGGAGGGEGAAGGEGGSLGAELVVECVGADADVELARAAGLEVHPTLGGVVVNAELQARSAVWAAGDAACFHDAALGRRRVAHHDHAVLTGRRAARNMAETPEPYDHQSMFWSDLGPALSYEAIGIIDATLPTVGVFCEDAISDAGASAARALPGGPSAAPSDASESPALAAVAAAGPEPGPEPRAGAAGGARRYERGVVFYLRDQRVVGVLLWNLFNRMHVARQVLAQGEFEDLFEVAKLFAPHEDD